MEYRIEWPVIDAIARYTIFTGRIEMVGSALSLPQALDRALSAYKAGKFTEAEQAFGSHLPNMTSSMRFIYWRSFGRRCKNDLALASYDRALRLRPNDAEASYDRALLLRPNDVDALYSRGNTLRD